MGKMRYAHSILVRKPEGKRPLGNLRHRQENNLVEIGFADVTGWGHGPVLAFCEYSNVFNIP
jgi:hypothetical protein